DVVNLTMHALTAKQSGVFHCGSGHAFSFNEVIAELNKNLGPKLEPEYIENPFSFYQPHTEADMTKAKNELNFRPGYSPAKGIADYVSILEKNLTL
ncbi:MAG: ADP-glyceromanno-heptose 6-epimerase, partial [Limisphaerales bacterium]